MPKRISTPPLPLPVVDPPPPHRRAPGRARVEVILAATVALLREHASQDVTVVMVADRARIKRTSIYAHFASITAIYEELSSRYLRDTDTFVRDFVRRRNPASLLELVTTVIDDI